MSLRFEIPMRVAERVAARVVAGPNGCHISTYSTASHGYAQVGWQDGGVRHVTTAHRAAWVFANGPIPDGLTVDHLCRVRRCVNPRHLRLLTNVANATDNGQVPTNPLTDRFCGRGHPLAFSAKMGYRYCRECKVIRNKAYRLRRAAA